MGKGLVAVAALVLTLLGAPRSTLAVCPPLAAGSSALEALVASQETLAQHTAAHGRLSRSQMWNLFTSGALKQPPFVLWPSTGPAPLTVGGRWWWYPTDKPVKIEFDADGDGAPESVASVYERIEHTSSQPGHFSATVRVHDRHGVVRTHVTTVTVVSPTAVEGEIQARWDTFKDALRRRDIGGAIDCVHSASREQYRESLETLFTGPASTSVDRVLTSITPVGPRDGTLVYQMLRSEGGLTLSYQVTSPTSATAGCRSSASSPAPSAHVAPSC